MSARSTTVRSSRLPVRPGLSLIGVMLFVGCLGSIACGQGRSQGQRSCMGSNSHGPAALQLAGGAGAVSLCDGYSLGSGVGKDFGAPLSLASADFDGDGVPDLVSGYTSGGAGTLVIHRGNVAALWPYGDAIRNGTPAAFLPSPRTFSVPAAPDFIVTGDFDGDGKADIVSASRGGGALLFSKGDGRGGFSSPKRIELDGAVTDMIAGEIGKPDGLPEIAVAIATSGGASVLIYQSPLGAIKARPESFSVAEPVSAMAVGKFSDFSMRDLAVGAGNVLTLIHGRDRKLSYTTATSIAPPVVSRQRLGFRIQALAAGDFTGGAPSIAVLGNDGSVHVLEHSVSPQALTAIPGNSGGVASFQPAGAGPSGAGAASGTRLTGSAQRRAKVLSQLALQGKFQNAPEWTERNIIAMPAGQIQAGHALVSARMSGSLLDDLLVVDSAGSKVHVLSSVTGSRQISTAAGNGVKGVAAPMSLLTSLTASGAPVAVLPMRLNQHGLSGLVALESNVGGPIVMPQDTQPTAVFTVTNTSDITSASQKNSPPAGSLRAAMENAQSASGDNGGGIYSIVFNIPTTDPGYNATTGIWKIQPLSENVPNSLDNFALPPINATLTIDGYTQPGASPNTSATSDNARILIQIDGGLATTTGGSGLVPFDDVGTVIRGLAFTGWTNPAISNNTASGAEGIEANGVGDFIEGNFFGTADGSTASPNRIGIFADNGPLFGSAAGNTIGGTTPQARNILSGNNNSGILFLSTAYEAQLQGNFIGLDKTGKALLANPSQAGRSNIFDGAGLNGPYVTIGGTVPGSANVIAGNGTNVDMNDLTNGNAAKNSLVLGNLIGTDATGTTSFSGQGFGVSILHGVNSMTIGGTTAAARNVISGNLAGVYVYDNSFNNVVQGNYIGTDVTGNIAIPNLQQGFISGQTTTNTPPAESTTIGGSVAGAGNVISGNTSDGVQINGAYSTSPGYSPYLGNIIEGNFIGTDVSGTKAIPNKGNGVSVLMGGTNTVIGGTNGGLGNVIANNAGHGVLIDPGSTNGPGVANTTVANIIYANGGAGVRIASGTSNRVSANSIYGNAALGIDIDAAGPSTNTHCNATSSGANMLQNYPVLTGGAGTTFITATATDPSGNTSEFSKAVPANQTGNLLSLLGSFDGKANTTFRIEFFSNTAADGAANSQGRTYLGSTSITTDANCSGTITDPVNTTQADVSVTLSQSTTYFTTGADMGLYSYTATVTNNGPATAHSVMLTDMLPSQLTVSRAYCNVGPCQSPIVTSQGSCTVSGQTVTCNLGTLATGGTANITIPVQVLATGSITNTVNASATEADPNLGNNVSSTTANATPPYPFIDHLNPATVLVNSPAIILNIYGVGFTPNLTATFNGVSVPVVGYVDDQVCGGQYQPQYCSDLQVMVPASQLTTAGSFMVVVSDSIGDQTSAMFSVAAACTYSVYGNLDSDYENVGTNLIAGSVTVSTNVPSCPWTATSTVPWAAILDNPSSTGSGTVDIAIAPNTIGSTRSGSVTVAGMSFSFTQDAGSSAVCNVTLDQTAINAPATVSTGTINATLSNSSCAPFAEPYPSGSWVTITNKSNLLVASGPVNYSLAANNGPARNGSIAVGGNGATITQAAPSCYFTLSATSALAPAAGTMGSLTVTPTPSTCSWTATSSNTSQVQVTAGATGTGTGTVNYTVAQNNGGPITPTITIGNAAATSLFTVNQASAFFCTFTISPTSVSVTSNGTSNVFTVTASYGNCKWTAATNNPEGLIVTQGASGTGTGSVFYSVGQNTTGAPRTLTITAGCQTFTVNQDGTAVTNPLPTLTSLQPSSVTAGSAAFTLTVNGTNFVSGAVVNLNGSPRPTTFVSATQLTAAIPATDIASPGTASITVTNPAPGGGTSGALPLSITTVASNPVPTLVSLQPSTTAAGSAGFTMTVNGTNFISSSVVTFGGTALVTTYVSATQLTAQVPASSVATASTPSVTVTNPTPGGGTSNALTFTVTAANNPIPTLTTLQPSSTAAGSAAFTLTVTGTNFVSASVINFGGSPLATSFLSSTQLTATVPASSVATAGTPSVTVTNPTPGGGTSNALTFTVTAANNPVPTLTALQPSSTAAGSAAFTLTVSGTNFVSASVINFGGSALATSFVSSTQLTATVPASSVATPSTPSVTVTNPTPGGGSSNALTFTVNAANNPVPTLASLQPSSTAAGSATFTLTLSGTNFISSSVVSFAGSALATTYVSSTKLTATVPATAVAAMGSATVLVTNPTPGGGASNALTFSITAPNNPLPTLTALQPSTVAAGSAAFTLTVTGTNFISGSTVSFNGAALTTTYVSSTQLTAAVPANNVANAGTPPITVTNPSPGGGTSNSINLSVTALPSFALSSSGAQTVAPGGTAQYTIAIAALNGTYSNAVTLTASGLPNGATATFSPTSVTPNAGSANSTLTITLPPATAALAQPSHPWSLALLGMPFLGLLLLQRSARKRLLSSAIMLFAIVFSVGAMSGCGSNGFNYSSVSPQTFSIIVTGTSGTTTATTTLQLTVNYVTK